MDDGLIGPIRVIPPCMMTDKAAGTAKVMASAVTHALVNLVWGIVL